MSLSLATRWVVILLGGLLMACETVPASKGVVQDMQQIIEESIEANEKMTIPDTVSSALIPTISLGASTVPAIEDDERYDIAVNNVPAVQFFVSLVDGTKYNMVVHPEVSGTVTLNLTDVTIPEVLQAVRDVYGYEFVSTDYGYQVLPGRLQARIYQINYLNISRSGHSRTLVSTGSLTLETGGSSADDGDTGSRSRQSVLAGTAISTVVPETTFWTELEDSITAIIGSGQDRGVVVNPQSGVVVVRALPTELREVEKFLVATQLIVQRQVIIEAKIIEVRLNDDFQTGINWNQLLTPGDDIISIAHSGGGSTQVNETGRSDLQGQIIPDALPASLATGFGGVFTLAIAAGDFFSIIELLKVQGSVQVLSSPRIATMNNQKAVIKVGVDEFFVTDISSNNISSGTNTVINPNIELTPFFSGVALDVTPQISADGWVTLHIHPSISQVVDQQKVVTIGNLVQQLPLARSTVRETDSVVRARSGQVIVIGGLMQDIINDQEAGAPGLMDIPGIGNLFKHRKKSSTKSELVILLKPIVVDDGQVWGADLKRTLQSLRQIDSIMQH